MLQINQIPLLKVYKQKVRLPIVDRTPSMYSLVFANTNSKESLLALLNHTHILNNFKYMTVYEDFLYREKIGTRQYRKIDKKYQETLYEYIEENAKTRFLTPKTVQLAKKKNIIVSLIKYNEIFFELTRKLSYLRLPELYVKYISDKLNDDVFKDYKSKIMLIDIDAWVESSKAKKTKRDLLSNPISMILYLLKRNPEALEVLPNIDIILYNNKNMMMRINTKELTPKQFSLLTRQMKILSPKADLITFEDEESEVGIDSYNELEEKVKSVVYKTFNFTGEQETEEDLSEEVKSIINDAVDKVEVDDESTDVDNVKLKDELLKDEEFLKKVLEVKNKEKIGTSKPLSKRDELLREQQKSIKMDDMTLEELQNIVMENTFIEVNDVSKTVPTTNENMTKIRFTNFEKAYNDQVKKKDISNIILDLNNKSIPVYIRNINIEDTSDTLNLKETYTVELEDANRVRHKLKFDMPLFIDDKFMYIGGNKKVIIKQKFMKPICKTGPDECQVISNYNKIFVRRTGKKVSSEVENLKKLLAQPKASIKVQYGNVSNSNKDVITTIELDTLSKVYKSIKTKEGIINFNIAENLNDERVKKLKLEYNQLPIGFNKEGKVIILDNQSQLIEGTELTLIEYIVTMFPDEIQHEFHSMKGGKKFMYTKATMMEKHIPLVLVLASMEGLTKVMEKAGINYYFSDKKPQKDSRKGLVKFADGYLVYDNYPMKNSLLMNAFADIPTMAFEFGDMELRDTYTTIMSSMFGSANLVNAIQTFYEFMIDPITREILIDLGYPTDFVSVMLVANELLSDNAYPNENSMDNYRIRSNEIASAILHKAIADAYARYRDTAYNKNPKKISIKQDIVLKTLVMLQNTEDYSTLSPIVELEKTRAITSKGFVGINMDKAYNEAKRSFDDSMLGIMAISTSPDANCGVVRQLTMEPTVTGPRGYIDAKYKKLDELKDVNLFSPAELLSPLGASRDDSIRTAMATKQSKHIIPIAKASPVLISNGAEQTVQYHLSDDFVVYAKQDGEVVEVNDTTGIIVVKYKDGTHKAINTQPRVVKNGAGGFYLSNKMSCELKIGQKFKKNEILASDKAFFSNTLEGNKFNIGSLQKVAILSVATNLEDSCFITKKMSSDMSADVVMQKAVSINKNSNVDKMVKIGDTVKVGDELIRIENAVDDDAMKHLLASVGEELGEEIKSLGKTPIKTKYSGVIEDIKIYSTVELDELSPSLRKVVGDYYNKINEKKKQLKKYPGTNDVYRCGMLLNDTTSKIETRDGKIKGTEVGEGVLIEFYIKYKDNLNIGDKIAYFTALKSIVGEVIPEGLEPYSEFRPDEEISSTIAPAAILARMTPSVIITALGNKVLVELKRKLEEIYKS